MRQKKFTKSVSRIPSDTSAWVRSIRGRLGLSREKFAQEIGVHPRTISRWEKSSDISIRGAALQQLQALAARITPAKGQFTNARQSFRLGVCPDFSDTLLPLLATVHAYRDLNVEFGVPVTFVPVPWDDRVLQGMMTGVLDGVFYNEQRVTDYQFQSLCPGLRIASDYLKSGEFYVAFSLPGEVAASLGSDQSRVADLLELLWRSDTLKLLPPADMTNNLRNLRQATIQTGGELGMLATTDDSNRWLLSAAPDGLNLLLQLADTHPGQVVAYCGGQDQRAELELLAEQHGRRFEILTDFDVVGYRAPEQLRLNRLYVRADHSMGRFDSFPEILADVQQQIVKDPQLAASCETEIIRWQLLYNRRRDGHHLFNLQERDDVAFRRQVIQRTKLLSPALSSWLS